jgi:hypothetical protein
LRAEELAGQIGWICRQGINWIAAGRHNIQWLALHCSSLPMGHFLSSPH